MKKKKPSDLPPPEFEALLRPEPFRWALINWFKAEGRDYPWRNTEDAYAILVSEVMLQQTRVTTVLDRGYYTRWMERFPDAGSLAAASEEEVLRAWEGLGYYSRARNLQKTARAAVERFGGVFPASAEELLTLPGIGRYTAGAVASFAYNAPAPLVDGNVARVFARLFACDEEIERPTVQRLLWAWAERLVDPVDPRRYNSALMELGQRVCTVRAQQCLICPVRPWCGSAGPDADRRPRKKAARETVLVDEQAIFARRADGAVLLHQETGRRRQGLWKLPERTAAGGPVLFTTQYTITHHRVTVTVRAANPGESAGADEAWQPADALEKLAMPGPYRRMLNRLLAEFTSPLPS